jgi:hypothetical protein
MKADQLSTLPTVHRSGCARRGFAVANHQSPAPSALFPLTLRLASISALKFEAIKKGKIQKRG